MERLMEDALSVQRLLPWIESDEDIINFMRKIPLDRSHLRNQLTLHYFLKQKDSFVDDFEKEIENDAKEIVVVVPDISYQDIKDRLIVLGSMSNRKEVLLRQLLYSKRDLDTFLREVDVSTIKKRKSDVPHEDILESNSSSNDETNIKIKIRKIDGGLEVVSNIKPAKAVSTVIQAINEPSTSSTSITSSTSHSEPSAPDSTVLSTPAEINNDPYPEFTTILNNVMNKHKVYPEASKIPVSYKRRSPVPNIVEQHLVPPNTNSKEKEKLDEKIPNLANGNNVLPAITETSRTNSPNAMQNDDEPAFNLITYLQEFTRAPEQKIVRLCNKFKLCPTKKPDEGKLNYIINELFEDVIEVKSDDSNMSINTDNSEENTEEYQLPENYLGMMQNPLDQDRIVIRSTNENASLNTDAKHFKLKPPVLTLPVKTVPSNGEGTASKGVITFGKSNGPTLNHQILKQPVLILPEGPKYTKEIIIPAMPPALLTRSQAHKSRPKETLPQSTDTPMDLSGAITNDLPPVSIENNHPDLSEAGPSNVNNKKKRVVDEKLVLRLMEMFPEASPEYIRDVCDGKQWAQFDDVVTVILSAENYPKRPQRPSSPAKEVDLEEQYEIVKELLPDADPTYLRMQCERYINDEKGLKEFINQAVELKGYPTKKDYLRRQQLSAQQKQYTAEFNIEHFIQLFPEADKVFSDPNRKIKIDAFSRHYINLFFRNKYDRISARSVQQILGQNDFQIIPSNRAFEQLILNKHVMKSRRKPSPLPDNFQNIPLLQELAYLTHKEEIESYLLEKQKKEERERLEAKEYGLMQTCMCCFEEEVMPKDTFTCPSGCSFCRDCIKRSCEIAVGEGKTVFSCLANCDAEFTLQTLQNVLPPKMFSKLAQKKALAEIKAAGIEELEMCPFCDFATIPNESDKIFSCLNPDCMKESCRLCKEPNHVPLKCEEVEKDADVKARTFIENEMTAALIRKCWKCGTSFFKEEGCNKMTCSCGAQMCYICKKPVTDYSHFNGIGGDQLQLCPLYSDTNLLNQQNVMTAAQAAKAKIDPSNLKTDPTADVANHYNQRGKQLPREPHMDLLHVNVHAAHRHDLHRPQHVQRHPHHHQININNGRLLLEQRLPNDLQRMLNNVENLNRFIRQMYQH